MPRASKQLVIDVLQAVANEFVADIQVTLGSPIQALAIRPSASV